jgi:methylthioxylose transferase
VNAVDASARAPSQDREGARPAAVRTPWWVTAAVLAGGGALIVAAAIRGQWLRTNGSFGMLVNAPPLTGVFRPLFTPRSLLAITVGGVGIWGADRSARRAPWRSLLVWAFVAALIWAFALAFWDGVPGFVRAARSADGYATALGAVGDAPGSFVRGFVAHVRDYSAHVQAHPPGLVLVLWVMDRVGLSGPWWESALQLSAAAASVPALLLSVREVAGEDRARAAAPFLVLTPAAVAWSSGDAVFLGVASWAVASVVLASGARGRRSDLLALGGGLLGGCALMLSYGLVLVGLVPLAVVVSRRRWRVMAVAAAGVALVLAGAAAAGFWWLAGFRATRKLYREGISSIRPYGYFVWANIAAFSLAVGPAVWVGLTRLRDRRMWLLAGAALAAVAIADISGMSKAEVERIWLPFVPWLVAAAGVAFVTIRERRGWLGVQVACALVVQWLVRASW